MAAGVIWAAGGRPPCTAAAFSLDSALQDPFLAGAGGERGGCSGGGPAGGRAPRAARQGPAGRSADGAHQCQGLPAGLQV